jgi:hypothetical protein
MLKAVENPDSTQMAQGVMVTPEGGYVVAQPDSYVFIVHYPFPLLIFFFLQRLLAKTRHAS